jgi:hypothetical protein
MAGEEKNYDYTAKQREIGHSKCCIAPETAPNYQGFSVTSSLQKPVGRPILDNP